MNVSVSTIGDMFGQTAGPVSAPPRPDAPERRAQSPLAPEERQVPADTARQATSHRDPAEIRKEPPNQGRKDFNEVIRKKTKPEGAEEAPNSSKPTEQNAKSSTADQPGEVQTWLAQHSVAVQRTQKGTTGKAEPKGEGQLAQLLGEPKAGKAQPSVGEATASAELNLLATATKNQSKLKVVTPDTSKPMAAVNTQPGKSDNTGTIPTSNNTVRVTKGANAKELMPEAPIESAGKTTSAGTKPAIAEIPVPADTPKTPAPNVKDLVGEAFVDGNAKTAHAGEKAAIAGNSPATAQAKASQTQAQVVTADGQGSVPTGEIEADPRVAQTPSKSPSLNGRKPAHNSSHVSNGSPGRHSNAAAVQAPTGQTEGGGNSNSNSSLNSGSEQILSQTPPLTPIEQPSTIFTVDAKTASPPVQTLPGNPSPSVGDQILDSVRSSLSQQSGNKQITIQLNPPELGKVSVKLQEQDAQITGILEVSKAQTRFEIEQALPQIIRNLTDNGIQIKRFEVVLSEGEQSQQQAFKDPSLQDGAFGQHNSPDSGSSGSEHENAGTHYGLTGRGSYQSATELQEMLVQDDSIDILV